jgi:isoleucyl-tRNA synthetase
MDKFYEANQLRVFLNMYEQGLIYRSVKPVYWSPSSKTALAEAELEYYDKISKSVYVKFRLQSSLPEFLLGDASVSLLVWTTTPWTIPANKAVCVHPKARYCVVHRQNSGGSSEHLIVAADRLKDIQLALNQELPVLRTVSGQSLETLKYHHPFQSDCLCPVLPASHVTMESGTGLVHTAPAHGMEDYIVGKEYGLDLVTAQQLTIFPSTVIFGLHTGM